MGGDVPKQFLPVGGMPVLIRTLKRFYDFDRTLQIILVLPKAQQAYWLQLCQQYYFPLPSLFPPHAGDESGAEFPPYLMADGGETRFHSVQNGLALIPDDAEGVVAVHDGVRPFVALEVIARCFETARNCGAAVPVTPVVESLRHLSADSSESVPRDQYCLVQTPQTFDIQLLKAANRQPYRDTFTDDASVVESYGHPITLVEGNRENIKLTTPFDLRIAETLV